MDDVLRQPEGSQRSGESELHRAAPPAWAGPASGYVGLSALGSCSGLCFLASENQEAARWAGHCSGGAMPPEPPQSRCSHTATAQELAQWGLFYPSSRYQK